MAGWGDRCSVSVRASGARAGGWQPVEGGKNFFPSGAPGAGAEAKAVGGRSFALALILPWREACGLLCTTRVMRGEGISGRDPPLGGKAATPMTTPHYTRCAKAKLCERVSLARCMTGHMGCGVLGGCWVVFGL